MKRCARLICAVTAVLMILLCFEFGVAASAEQTEYENSELIDEYYKEQAQASGAEELFDALPENTDEMLDKIGIDDLSPSKLINMQPQQVWELLLDMLKQQATAPLKCAAGIAAVIILHSLFDGANLSGSSLSQAFSYVCAICAGMLIIVPAMSCFDDCTKATESCQIFLTAYIPAFAAILASCGQPIASTIYSAVLFGASEGICLIGQQIILPLARIFFSLAVICSLLPTVDLNALVNTVSKTATWILSLCTTVYAGILTIQGAVGASADSLTLKTAKYFASSLVPVVGGAVSESMSTIFSSMSLLKTTTGVIGIIICVLMFLPTITELICYRLSFSLCGALAQTLGAGQIGSLLKSASTATGIMIALQVCYAILVIISTAVMIMLKAS